MSKKTKYAIEEQWLSSLIIAKQRSFVDFLIFFLNLFVGKTITRWIKNPRVVVGAFHAGVKTKDLSGQFSVEIRNHKLYK